jgi:hypothetical protein
MYGSFSQKSLQDVKGLFDFTICQRPDGSRYGTSGKCRKGVEVQPEISAKEKRRRAVKAAQKEGPPLTDDPNFPDYSGGGREARAALERDYKLMRAITYGKGYRFSNPESIARLINFRIEINKLRRAAAAQNPQLDSKKYQSILKKSPKYDKTPGSKSPVKKPSGSEDQSLAEIQERLFKRMREASTQAEKLEISREILDVTRRLEDVGPGRNPRSPGLTRIYAEQGFNSRPELVGTVADLQARRDIRTNPDGSPMILYRGVSSAAFADQFRGLGKDGAVHYPGRGMFGNGSYAATENTLGPGTAIGAIDTARDYAGTHRGIGKRVVPFAIRADANVVEFSGDSNETRSRQFKEWQIRTLKEAEEKTGYEFEDLGEAAAALGIHAYRVPRLYPAEDYYVILNRGAIIAAIDSGLSD